MFLFLKETCLCLKGRVRETERERETDLLFWLIPKYPQQPELEQTEHRSQDLPDLLHGWLFSTVPPAGSEVELPAHELVLTRDAALQAALQLT